VHTIPSLFGSDAVTIIFIIAHIVSIWGFVDIFRSDFKDPSSRYFWMMILLLVPAIGMVIYFRTGHHDKVGAEK